MYIFTYIHTHISYIFEWSCSVTQSRRPYIYLTHCVKLSFCEGCLWGISCLVSWPFLYLSASPSSLAYHCPASFFNIDFLSASTSLMLMFCVPLHLPLTDILHTIVSLHVVSLLVSACRQPLPLVSGLHGGFFCCYSVKCASAFKKKITPLSSSTNHLLSRHILQYLLYKQIPYLLVSL